MHTNPLSGARYPDSTDSTNLSAYYQDLADDLSSVAVPQFASSTARDSAWSTFTSAGHTLTNGSVCAVNGELQVYRGKWVSAVPVLYRRIAGTATGTLGSGSSSNLTASQPIPASPFGTSVPFMIDADATIHASGVPTSAGARLEIFFDGTVQDGDVFTNTASTQEHTWHVRSTMTVADNSTHTVVATITGAGGTSTFDGTYQRLILILRPYLTF